ncbi:hypothetical protein DOY81_013501, partial [Sarcophaga bullata]
MYNSDTGDDSMMIANGSPHDQNEPHYTNLDQQHGDMKGSLMVPKLGHKMISPEDLERALEAIRAGHTSVQKASAEFGIPTGTLYGRCKREGIELSRSNPTPWSEDAMNEALNSVRIGQMSINQAAIHYNLPYSSLYGRFKRGKYDVTNTSGTSINNTSEIPRSIEIIEHSQENSVSKFQIPIKINHH